MNNQHEMTASMILLDLLHSGVWSDGSSAETSWFRRIPRKFRLTIAKQMSKCENLQISTHVAFLETVTPQRKSRLCAPWEECFFTITYTAMRQHDDFLRSGIVYVSPYYVGNAKCHSFNLPLQISKHTIQTALIRLQGATFNNKPNQFHKFTRSAKWRIKCAHHR